jgi:hypothetical protein
LDQVTAFFFHVSSDDRPLFVRQRSTLSETPDTAVVLGEAPDGLPLILRVSRPGSVEQAVIGALGYPPRDALPAAVLRSLDALEAAVRDEGRKIGIQHGELGAVYRSSSTVGGLLGETMLARLIGAHSPLILPDDRYQPSSQPEQIAHTGMFAQQMQQRPVTAMKELDRERYLVVPVGPGPIFVASLGDDEASSQVTGDVVVPLRFEDLRGLPSARFRFRKGAVEYDGALADERAYARAVKEADAIAWTVDRNDVAGAIAGLARDVAHLHQEGRVHCDVKPGNTLVTADGTIAIDPLGVRAGEQSPGATPGWAAPEQILARPVSPPTDVYALGLMAAALVGAVIFGEERSFVIPIGRAERRRLRVLSAPDVFLDPTSSALDDAGRAAWCALVRDAVAFAPEHRPADGVAFADRLAGLLDDYPLAGQLSLRGGPGSLSRSVEVLGSLQPSWIVDDRY